MNGTAITLNSVSHDLDSNENIGFGEGIASEKWYYKEATATNWTEGKLTTFEKNKIFMLRLDVTDKQGVTSSAIKYVGIGAPVANFTVDKTELLTTDKLEIKNTSYDPQGNDITKYEWTLKRGNIVVATYNTPLPPEQTFYENGFSEGDYTYTLKITNSVGTESEVFTKAFTVEKAIYRNKYEHWLWGFTGKEGNNANKDAFLLQTTYNDLDYNAVFKPDATYALTVPKGFYLEQKFETDQIEGVNKKYDFGMVLNQPTYPMEFKFNYYPNVYTVNYTLNGGTNNSANPNQYTILYGYELKNPTRKGYDFLGWYDASNNKITGINAGCDAKFSSTIDLYTQLQSRSIGNLNLTAKWQVHTYNVNTSAGAGGIIGNSCKLQYQDTTSIFIMPMTGYKIKDVVVNGKSMGAVSTVDCRNIDKDYTIIATFTK